jgi:hypothetical protein
LRLKYIITIVVIIFVGLMQAGCSQPNSDAPPSGQAHAINYTNPESGVFHGIEVNESGSDGCISCHGNNLAGTGSISGCYDCHFDPQGSQAPPNTGWTHGRDGHVDFIAYQDVCYSCHNTVRRFGLPPEYCHYCHSGVLNHLLEQPWLDKNSPVFHGATALADCSDCHDLSQKCFLCHFGQDGSKSPQGSGWSHGNNSEHEDYKSYQDTCNRCHDLNRGYGNEPASCHDCHED